MRQRSDSGEASPALIWIAMVVTTIVLIVVAVIALRPAPPSPQQSVAAVLENDPTSRQWVAALRKYYPREYRDLIDRVGAASVAGVDARIRAQMSFIDDFLARKIDAIVSVPDAQLLEIASAKAETLRRDRDCNPTGVTDADPWTAPAIAQSRVMALEIAAAHAGETSGRRPRRRWGPADYEALRARMEARDPELMRAMPNGPSPRETPELQCRYDLLQYRPITELPPAVGAVIMAEFLRTYVEVSR